MITSIYASIFSLMLIGLSINVVKGRRKFAVGLGDTNNIQMTRRIRAQANFAEYAPIFIILLGFAEHNGLPVWAINLFGLTFLAGRIMHAYSLLKAEKYDQFHKLTTNPIWRISGMICTFNSIGLLAIIVLLQNLL